jgi:hypothetical protein
MGGSTHLALLALGAPSSPVGGSMHSASVIASISGQGGAILTSAGSKRSEVRHGRDQSLRQVTVTCDQSLCAECPGLRRSMPL